MTREEIIQGLQFTIDMFLFDPTTGEMLKEPRNDMDKTTIDACKGAIELLEQQPCEDAISRKNIEKLKRWRFSYDTNTTIPKSDLFVKLADIRALPLVQPKPKTEHWISVNERLPEIRQNVLCQCRGNIYSILRLNHNGDWECIYPHTTYMQSFVTAWMSLPEPYKPQESEDEE